MDTDIIHAFGAEAEWSESFYFNFYDRAADVCGFMRIGLKPNKKEKSVFCFLMLPDGSIVGIKGEKPFDGMELSINGLSFTKVEAEKHWKMEFGGRMAKMTSPPQPVKVSFTLDFTALNDIFDYRACVNAEKVEMSKSVVSEHLEQFGRITGTIMVGDMIYQINGTGERDHSWGVREWTAPKMWIWLTCQFSAQEALNVTKLAVEQGTVDAGFIHVDGKSHPIDQATIDTAYDEHGGPKAFHVVIKDTGKRSYEIDAEIIKKVMLPFVGPDGKVGSLMYETLARYRMDGKVGYGIAEYLIKKY